MCAVVGEQSRLREKGSQDSKIYTSFLGTVHGYKYKPQILAGYIL